MDNYGKPLAKCIPQKTHDEVSTQVKKGNWQEAYNHWVAAGHTVDYLNTEIATRLNTAIPKANTEISKLGGSLPRCISKETADFVIDKASKGHYTLPYNHWLAAGLTIDYLNNTLSNIQPKPVVILPPEVKPITPTQPNFVIDKTPRGFGTLQAMVPTARPQVDTLVNILLESGISRPAFNVLFGGFGEDTEYLKSIIIKLNSEGRKAHMLYYMLNGPSQRRWNATAVKSFEVNVEPKAFRKAIISDQKTQQNIIARAKLINELCVFNSSLGGVNRVTLMLEDNLDDNSFQHLFNLVKPIFISGTEFVRNPCVGAYPGNEGGIPSGCFRESHDTQNQNFNNGISTNDGETFKFGRESLEFSRQISLSKLNSARDIASRKNNWFFLWCAKYQGLTGNTNPDPFGRPYAVPTNSEKAILKKFILG